MGDDEWPQQQAQRDVMLADFDFHNGFGDRSVCFSANVLPLWFQHCVCAVLTSHNQYAPHASGPQALRPVKA